MKKLLLLTSLVSVLSAANMTSFSIGGSDNGIDYSKSSEGFYIAYDFMPGNSRNPFSIGLGFDANIFSTNAINPSILQSAYTMGAVGKIGISLVNIGLPANIKFGGGWGVFDVGNYDSYGPQYEVSLDFKVYGNYGTGFKYKVVKAEYNGQKFDVESGIAYFTISTF